MGRKATAGRYISREELCREVWRMYRGPQNIVQIARVARVSESTVSKILSGKEGMPAPRDADNA